MRDDAVVYGVVVGTVQGADCGGNAQSNGDVAPDLAPQWVVLALLLTQEIVAGYLLILVSVSAEIGGQGGYSPSSFLTSSKTEEWFSPREARSLVVSTAVVPKATVAAVTAAVRKLRIVKNTFRKF